MEQSNRTCGSCSACCYTHNIEELDKWNFSPCPHMQNGGGCTIYGEHPKSCQTFACVWLKEVAIRTDYRPDKLGLVIHSRSEKNTKSRPVILMLLEAWPEAFETSLAQKFAHEEMKNGVALLIISPTKKPDWQYHLYRLPETESYGEMLVERGYAVTWHEPTKMGHPTG